MANNEPTTTLRDDRLKATIWEQPSENGSFYCVIFARGYQDDNGARLVTLGAP